MYSDIYENFMEFENMQWDSIKKWIPAARKSNLNGVGFSVSDAKEKRIQSLSLWVNKPLYIGRVKFEYDFDDTDFTTINMTEMVYEAYINYLDFNTNSDVSTPGNFSYNKCDIWEDTVRNWLNTKRGVTNLPLSYVICKDSN